MSIPFDPHELDKLTRYWRTRIQATVNAALQEQAEQHCELLNDRDVMFKDLDEEYQRTKECLADLLEAVELDGGHDHPSAGLRCAMKWAAINLGDLSTSPIKAAAMRGPKNQIIWLLPPARHHNLIRFMASMGWPTPITWEQGFIDYTNRFLNRYEAAKLVNHPKPQLYSEDLW